MATVTHVCTIAHVAEMLGEDQDLLEAIVCNDDNLTCGSSISVHAGQKESMTALTDDGIRELADMVRAARLTTQTWYDFLGDFVDDPELVARIKAKSPR